MGNNKILVLCASKRGSARQAAEWIAEELGENADLHDLSKSPAPSLAPYDVFVIGSGIQMGKVYSPLKKFIKVNKAEVMAKKYCLFITHLAEGEEIEDDFHTAFDEDFLAGAEMRTGLGGWVELKKLNFLARPIMKKIASEKGVDITNFDTLSQQSCIDFAHAIRTVCLD